MGRWWFTSGFWGNFTSSFVPFSCSPCRESQVCKVVDLSKTDDDDAGAFKEATLLASLHHPYIVRYRDSFCTDARQHLRKKNSPRWDYIRFQAKFTEISFGNGTYRPSERNSMSMSPHSKESLYLPRNSFVFMSCICCICCVTLGFTLGVSGYSIHFNNVY